VERKTERTKLQSRKKTEEIQLAHVGAKEMPVGKGSQKGEEEGAVSRGEKGPQYLEEGSFRTSTDRGGRERKKKRKGEKHGGGQTIEAT